MKLKCKVLFYLSCSLILQNCSNKDTVPNNSQTPKPKHELSVDFVFDTLSYAYQFQKIPFKIVIQNNLEQSISLPYREDELNKAVFLEINRFTRNKSGNVDLATSVFDNYSSKDTVLQKSQSIYLEFPFINRKSITGTFSFVFKGKLLKPDKDTIIFMEFHRDSLSNTIRHIR